MYFVGPFGMHNTCRGYVYASSLTDKRLFLAQALTLDTCITAPPSVVLVQAYILRQVGAGPFRCWCI